MPPEPKPADERSHAPFPGRWQHWRARWSAFDLRDRWWRLLDLLEARRGLRLALYGAVAFALALGAAWYWGHPWWIKRNALRVAQQWMDAGKLNYAAEAVQQVLTVAPEKPESWQLAARLAWLQGQKTQAVEHARQAAQRGADRPELTLEWASYALRAENPAEAAQALASLRAGVAEKSGFAQRLLGELARRIGDLSAAKNHFETASRLEGPAAVNEVPLGLVLLDSADAAERQRGIDLLAKWTGDREWGVTALRTLLSDALNRNDRGAMLKWGEALRTNPGCTVSDVPTCLRALSLADAARFAEVIAGMEKDHAVSPRAAADLLGWLNQIGRSDEAVRWMKTLPAQAMHRPPLAVLGAEALRATGAAKELEQWTEGGDWGTEVDFLRWAYGMQAARMLGNDKRAEELRRTLYEHAQLNGVHALFAASTIYGWGRTTEAEALWWRAAEQEGKIAIDALGSLARHYQVKRDADGQYRVFRRWHLLQPQEPAVANNFAFFAALNGREQRLAEQVARENLARDPNNPTYAATYAFALLAQGRAHEARRLLDPMAAEAGKSPALAFAYGLALASTGDRAAAAKLLNAIDPATLTAPETELIKSALDGR